MEIETSSLRSIDHEEAILDPTITTTATRRPRIYTRTSSDTLSDVCLGEAHNRYELLSAAVPPLIPALAVTSPVEEEEQGLWTDDEEVEDMPKDEAGSNDQVFELKMV